MTTPSITSTDYKQLMLVVQQLSNRVQVLEESILNNTANWTNNQDNVTLSRSYDADTVTLAELADVVGTLISDLIEMRLLK